MLGTITLTVGQTDSVSQKEEVLETMDGLQGEVASQVNGEMEEKGSPDADNITASEEKAAEEKPGEANEVGFKKIFRFVGFKFTLKKDKNEKTDPVQLLTVKDKDEEVEATGSEEVQEEVSAEAEVKAEGQAVEAVAATVTTDAMPEASATADAPAADAPAEAVDDQTATEEAAKEEEGEKEPEDQAESPTSPPGQEVIQSPFRKFFSNLRKKASIKKPKEEEPKEAATKEEIKEGEEGAEAVAEDGQKAEAVMEEVIEEQAETGPEEDKSEAEATVEAIPVAETATSNEIPVDVKSEVELAVETQAPAAAETTDEPKLIEVKVEEALEGDKVPTEVTSEAELLSSQEKTKAQGSPLKKLFTGAGLKKLSTKKQKTKKDAEAKLTKPGEQVSEQLQSSTESTEAQKLNSGPSTPEDLGEHVIGAEASQAEAGQDAEGEGTTSDGEKKKEGIIPWSSFKKLVTPKKRVKRSSESEDEATGDKAKTATMSSTESAVFEDKPPSEEESKPTEEEPKTETTEKLESSTEEPKKKMDTSVSWEALMCMGGKTKRTRRTSDSDEEDIKIEEEAQPAGEEKAKATESPIVSSQEAEPENTMSSPEPPTSMSEGEVESTWETLKRFVIQRKKPKTDEKTEEAGHAEIVLSDSEIPKEESSFSLRKLIPGRRKKKTEKQLSSDVGSGEEDSDTPAVVPLSEYDNEQLVPIEVTPVVTQAKGSSEDRSPSWISTLAVTEEVHEQLSDIPEEGDNAATPKSADTTMAEEIEDLTTEAMEAQEKVPVVSAAEVTMELLDVTPAGETTPMPDAPEPESVTVVLEEAVDVVCEIPSQHTVSVIDVPTEQANTDLEPQPAVEFAECETKVILKAHIKDEATAICTGLGTKEIAKVAVEKHLMPVVECMAVVSDSLVAEVPIEDKAEKIEEAVAAEDPVFETLVEQVEATELEPALKSIVDRETPEPESASEGKEPEIVKVAIVSSIQTEAEIVQPPVVTENTPKVEMVDAINPTFEKAFCVQIAEVNVPAVAEAKTKEMDVEEITADEGNAAVVAVSQAVLSDIVSGMSEDSSADEVVEAAIAVVAPLEEYNITKETVCLVGPLPMEPDQVEIQQEEKMKLAPVSEAVASDVESQVLEKNVPVAVAEPVVESEIGAATSEVNAFIVEASEKMQEDKEAEEEASSIEEQGMVIAQVVIQNALTKVAQAKPEEEKPATPTADAPATGVPTPVQAVLTTEKEVVEEHPVIAEPPVVQYQAEKPVAEAPAEDEKIRSVHEAVQVIETVQVEVIDAPTLKEPEEPGKQKVNKEVELKQAAEVNLSEEKVEKVEEVKEEVKEIASSQMNLKNEEIQKENHTAKEVSQDASPTEIKDIQPKVQHAEVKEITQVASMETVTPVLQTPSQPEEKKPAPVVLQATEVHVEQAVEEIQIEAVIEFDSTGVVNNVEAAAKDASAVVAAETNKKADQAPVMEEAEKSVSADTATSSQEAQVPPAVTSSVEPAPEKPSVVKCAEVMAQVIEVIEEAVREIEPASTELTAAS